MEKKLSRKQKKWFAYLWIVLVLLFSVYLVTRPAEEWRAVIADAEALGARVAFFGIWSPLIMALINIALVVVAMLPGHVVMMASGFLYGLLPGFLLNHTSILLGSVISFYIARRFGRPMVERLAPAEILDRLDNAAKGHGFKFFLACYALPFFPVDALNFVAGLSPLTLRSFVLANLFGRAWISLAITAIGTYSAKIVGLEIPIIGWFALMVVSIIIYRAWKSIFYKQRVLTKSVKELDVSSTR